jgi:D-alanyl-D-alanine carboxypeptidase/D-alanyl-D-alanine-endopeptidase (penicillin-binding protein 4)
MSDSALGVGLLLAQTLNALGITVAGGVVVSEAPLPPNAYPLAILDGLTLREQLGRMLRFSNNYIADVLTMDLAVDTLATPPADLSGAALVLTQFMGRVMGRMEHAGSGAQQQGLSLGPSLLSGSGLTTENRLSASDLATLLAYQYHNTAHFPAFYGALTVPREAPFGFMRQGSDAWLDRVAFKTGTMNEPVSVCGIAGYLRKRDGGWIAFAVIVNGGPGASHIPHETAMRAVRSDLEDILAHE